MPVAVFFLTDLNLKAYLSIFRINETEYLVESMFLSFDIVQVHQLRNHFSSTKTLSMQLYFIRTEIHGNLVSSPVKNKLTSSKSVNAKIT
jgi:hypothetical protein